MIRLLSEGDAPLIEKIPPDCCAGLRLRALWRAYGGKYDFVRFYAGGNAGREGALFLCVQESGALVWARENAGQELLDEAAELLPLLAGHVTASAPLGLGGATFREGLEFRGFVRPVRAEGISEDPERGFAVLSQVFPGQINRKTHDLWYADLSHRMRRGISKIYTLEDVCTATLFCQENGWLEVEQLAVLPAFRGRGLARRMLSHLAADVRAGRGILLQSQDSASDGFYRRMGFLPSGRWYSYHLSSR